MSHRSPRPLTTRFRPRLVPLEDRAVPAFGFGSAFGYGTAGDNFGGSLALDAAGNTYVSGYYSGTVDFDSNQTNPASNHVLTTAAYNGYVAKYAADGTFQWVADLGTHEGAAARVAVGGSAVYASTYGGGSVARLDPATGAVLWDTPVAGGGRTLGLAVDPAGNVDVTGGYGTSGAFVAQLNPAGGIRWTRTSTGGTNTNGIGLAVDAAGTVYVTGAYQGTVNFGSTRLSSRTGTAHDAFVWKLTSSGGHVWAGSMGNSGGDDRGTGIAVDGTGKVLVTGWFDAGANNFNPGSGKAVTLTNRGAWDVFVAKLASANNGSMSLVWAKGFGGTGVDAGQGLALDAAGSVYTTGAFGGPANFNPGGGPAYTLTPAGGSDAFVSKLGANGNFVAAAGMGGAGYDGGRGIAVDAAGTVSASGTYQLSADFDPTAGTYNLTADSGAYAVFVLKLTQSGTGALANPGAGGAAPRLGDADAAPVRVAADAPRAEADTVVDWTAAAGLRRRSRWLFDDTPAFDAPAL